jgi:starch phosphorylase
MKFALNGALTIGTLDGANIEIREAVGKENFFLFGLTEEQVVQKQREGYRPRQALESNPELKEALDLVARGFFSPEDKDLFAPLVQSLLNEDRYMLLEDFASYAEAQQKVEDAYMAPEDWSRMAALNIARVGQFSSDRTIKQYAEEIWRIKPMDVEL